MHRILKHVPKPYQIPIKLKDSLRVLLISEKVNTLTRRVQNVLNSRQVVNKLIETRDPTQMLCSVEEFQPDVIVCPFMKARLPEDLCNDNHKTPCLIVHPGIEGDSGACSLDWAILRKEQTWGVTVLEASPVFDKGDVWCTEYFPVPENSTKSSLYKGPVSDTAVRCVVDALSRYSQSILPTPLCEIDAAGTSVRNMKNHDRQIDWSSDSDMISAQVRMSDTRPGAIGTLHLPGFQDNYRMFDAHVETGKSSKQVTELLKKANFGDIVAQKNKSILIKTGDDKGVWIGQMKKMTKEPTIKLPSVDFLTNVLKTHVLLPTVLEACDHDDIHVVKRGKIAYVYFDFYNGAMDRQQALRLQHTLTRVGDMADISVVALMGGDRFFSTGIHLCVIEGSPNKEVEAWANINAINDVIETFTNLTNKTTVAVIRGNAGAGGAMLAAACDLAVSYQGALLTPSYKAMHLYGSEYWTYFLPRRVGHSVAKTLVETTNTLSAKEAMSIGLLDHVLMTDKKDFVGEVSEYLQKLVIDGETDNIVHRKRIERDTYWRQLLHAHRNYELSQMQTNFHSPDYIRAMHNFVFHR